jgi:hypothetical protein
MRLSLALPALVIVGSIFGMAGALADQTVSVGGTQAVLLRPQGAPRASVILMPGGDGVINAGPDGSISGRLRLNTVVRNRHAFVARGLAVLVTDAQTDLASAVQYMAAIKRPVTVVAFSRGTIRAAIGIARGARPDALVLGSGLLSNESGDPRNVASILGSPNALPRTLVLHHRRDGCDKTQPAGVEPFLRWAAGRATVAWLDGGGNAGNPCGARGYHGFNGLDDHFVGYAAEFR